jgi:hypothetical protein
MQEVEIFELKLSRNGQENSMSEQSEQNVVYLDLYHGRTDPKADMSDWGTMGPVFAGDQINVMYGNKIRIMKDSSIVGFLQIVEGLVYYDGVYYGEFSIDRKGPYTDRLEQFDPKKAERGAYSSTPHLQQQAIHRI